MELVFHIRSMEVYFEKHFVVITMSCFVFIRIQYSPNNSSWKWKNIPLWSSHYHGLSPSVRTVMMKQDITWETLIFTSVFKTVVFQQYLIFIRWKQLGYIGKKGQLTCDFWENHIKINNCSYSHSHLLYKNSLNILPSCFSGKSYSSELF